MLTNKIYNEAKNRSAALDYKIQNLFGSWINDLTPRFANQESLMRAFRLAKERAVADYPEGRTAFSWALHDRDGRGEEFQTYDAKAWGRWLAWYRFHHFIFSCPASKEKALLDKKIHRLGAKTWQRLFRRYLAQQFYWHDSYSLPDVFFVSQVLGHVPQRVIDVGAGWGRLGMAWTAVGAKWIAIADSIEQPYVVQHQYLSAIPGVQFCETLLPDGGQSSSSQTRGVSEIVHLPTWDLTKVLEKSVEVVSAIQVLREVDKTFLDFLFQQLKRILVPGGLFYVRENDHEYQKQCMHQVDVTAELVRQGFEVVKFDLVQGRDIHGVPRVFRLK